NGCAAFNSPKPLSYAQRERLSAKARAGPTACNCSYAAARDGPRDNYERRLAWCDAAYDHEHTELSGSDESAGDSGHSPHADASTGAANTGPADAKIVSNEIPNEQALQM